MMNTIEAKREYWANHIKDWKTSGETQSHYCQHHNLKPHQLSYWVRVFKSNSRADRSTNSKGFVALQVTHSATTGLTIRLPNGLQLGGVTAGDLAVVREMMEWSL